MSMCVNYRHIDAYLDGQHCFKSGSSQNRGWPDLP